MGGPINLRRLGEACSRLESEPNVDDPPFADVDYGQWALPRHQGMGRRLTVAQVVRNINLLRNLRRDPFLEAAATLLTWRCGFLTSPPHRLLFARSGGPSFTRTGPPCREKRRASRQRMAGMWGLSFVVGSTMRQPYHGLRSRPISCASPQRCPHSAETAPESLVRLYPVPRTSGRLSRCRSRPTTSPLVRLVNAIDLRPAYQPSWRQSL